MRDEERIVLYENQLRLHGALLLSRANADVFRRARPRARFLKVPKRPELVRLKLPRKPAGTEP